MRDLYIACGQFATEAGAKSQNVARMVTYSRQAKEKGCELILFPELIVTGYLPPDQVRPLAEPLNGPTVLALARAAREIGIAIAFGMAESHPQRELIYNSLVVLDAGGEIVGLYRKVHLWASEKQWATPGNVVPVFHVAGTACSGWICYDTRFPEIGRLAALQGADLALVPTAWLGPGDEWELALRARALDNSIFVAGADIISYDPVLRCYGRSMIVGPKGKVLAHAEPEQEGIIDAVLKVEDLLAQRKRVPLLADRRPELYEPLAS